MLLANSVSLRNAVAKQSFAFGAMSCTIWSMARPSSVATSGSSKSSTSTTGWCSAGCRGRAGRRRRRRRRVVGERVAEDVELRGVEGVRQDADGDARAVDAARQAVDALLRTPWLVTAPTCVRALTACITAPTPGAVATAATLSSATKPVSSRCGTARRGRWSAGRAPAGAAACPRGRRPARGGRRRAHARASPGSRACSGPAAGREPSPALGAGGGDTRRARPFPRFPGRGSFAPAAPGAPRATRPAQTPTTDQQPRRERVAMYIPPKISASRHADAPLDSRDPLPRVTACQAGRPAA